MPTPDFYPDDATILLTEGWEPAEILTPMLTERHRPFAGADYVLAAQVVSRTRGWEDEEDVPAWGAWGLAGGYSLWDVEETRTMTGGVITTHKTYGQSEVSVGWPPAAVAGDQWQVVHARWRQRVRTWTDGVEEDPVDGESADLWMKGDDAAFNVGSYVEGDVSTWRRFPPQTADEPACAAGTPAEGETRTKRVVIAAVLCWPRPAYATGPQAEKHWLPGCIPGMHSYGGRTFGRCKLPGGRWFDS